MIVLLIPLLIERGYSGSFAATSAGIVGISQLPGRVIFGALGRSMAPASLLTGIYATAIAAAAVLLVADAAAVIITGAVLLGASNGMSTLAHGTLLGDRYGTDRYGTIGALSALFVTLAMALAPVIAATLPVALGGSLDLVLIAAMALSGLAAIAAIASYGPRRDDQVDCLLRTAAMFRVVACPQGAAGR